MTDPRVYTPAQVAELFGVTENTIRRWARTGYMPTIPTPPGGLVLIPRMAVEKMLQGELPRRPRPKTGRQPASSGPPCGRRETA